MTIQSDTFQMGQIASAIGVSPQTIKTWLHNKIVTGESYITGGGGAGKRRIFTFNNVMEFATAKAIMDIGMQRDPAAAFQAAKGFAHTGHGLIGGSTVGRHPGFPYYDGRTLLCTTGEYTTVIQHNPGTDVLPEIRISLRRAASFIVVDMGDVFDLVVKALGYDASKEIELAYMKAN